MQAHKIGCICAACAIFIDVLHHGGDPHLEQHAPPQLFIAPQVAANTTRSTLPTGKYMFAAPQDYGQIVGSTMVFGTNPALLALLSTTARST
jgi:hypothetical protein